MKDQIENYLNRLNNTIEKLSQNEILICCLKSVKILHIILLKINGN